MPSSLPSPLWHPCRQDLMERKRRKTAAATTTTTSFIDEKYKTKKTVRFQLDYVTNSHDTDVGSSSEDSGICHHPHHHHQNHQHRRKGILKQQAAYDGRKQKESSSLSSTSNSKRRDDKHDVYFLFSKDHRRDEVEMVDKFYLSHETYMLAFDSRNEHKQQRRNRRDKEEVDISYDIPTSQISDRMIETKSRGCYATSTVGGCLFYPQLWRE